MNHQSLRVIGAVLVCVLMTSCSFHPDQSETTSTAIGKVEVAHGMPQLLRNGELSNIETMQELERGDVLITAENSRLRLRMIDDTTINLGENTRFSLLNFGNVAGRNVARFSLTRGAFRAKTGRFPSRQNATFEIATPMAVIGVRGTDFWGGDIFEDSQIDVALLSPGEIYVSNEFGMVEVVTPGHGTTVVPGFAPTLPELWQPSKASEAIASTQI